MNSYRKILATIKHRPGMYLGKCSISLLSAFLGGWSFAKDQQEITDRELFDGFNEWIVAKYRITTSHGWASIILFMEQEEHRALASFWTLFDDFLRARGLEPISGSLRTGDP
jgi:hypothetical protein